LSERFDDMPSAPEQAVTVVPDLAAAGTKRHWSTYRFKQGDVIANGRFQLFMTIAGAAGQGFTNRAMTHAETNYFRPGILREIFHVHAIFLEVVARYQPSIYERLAFCDEQRFEEEQKVYHRYGRDCIINTEFQDQFAPLLLWSQMPRRWGGGWLAFWEEKPVLEIETLGFSLQFGPEVPPIEHDFDIRLTLAGTSHPKNDRMW